MSGDEWRTEGGDSRRNWPGHPSRGQVAPLRARPHTWTHILVNRHPGPLSRHSRHSAVNRNIRALRTRLRSRKVGPQLHDGFLGGSLSGSPLPGAGWRDSGMVKVVTRETVAPGAGCEGTGTYSVARASRTYSGLSPLWWLYMCFPTKVTPEPHLFFFCIDMVYLLCWRRTNCPFFCHLCFV